MTIVLINLDGDQYWREEGKYKTRTAKTKPADFDILVLLIMIHGKNIFILELIEDA